MDNNFGIKDLYKGYLLAGPKTTLNGYQYQENEIILEFDDIQKIAFGEDIQSISARGGYQNPALINWESVRQMYGAIDMGRVSPNTFALLSRSNITTVEDSFKSIPNTETKYIEDDGIIYVGDKITQMVILPVILIDKCKELSIEEYNELMKNSKRGSNAMGSSDVKH